MAMYAVTLLAFGTCSSWAAPSFNNPAFAEIVPSDMRTMIYAFDRSLEMALAALAAPLVGILAERVFGYEVGPRTFPTRSVVKLLPMAFWQSR